MANIKKGFEGILYYGTAGSTAATQLTGCGDITVGGDVERGNTTARGDSTVPPIETEDVTIRKLSIEFDMLNDATDTSLAALNTAWSTGTGVALRGKDYSSGHGPDGDFTLSRSAPWKLKDTQVVTFTAMPTRSYGRSPTNYS
jgi:hypothetical protein